MITQNVGRCGFCLALASSIMSRWISRISSPSSAVRTGSRPESGSSNSTMSGSSTSARANPARLRIPPESSLGILSRALPRPTSLEAAHDDVLDLVLALLGVLAQRERDVVVEVHRAEQRAVLEQQPELLAHLEQLVVGHVRDRLAVHDDVALVGVQQADHVLDADRLPGPRGADDHRHHPLGKAHAQPAQDLRAAERLVDVDELDRVRAARRVHLVAVPLVVLLGGAAGRRRARRLLVDDRHARGRARRPASAGALARSARRARGSAPTRADRRRAASRLLAPGLRLKALHDQPPIGALGLAPQKSCVPSIPMRCTATMLRTIDFAVAVPTPTGPPLAL